MRDKIFALVHDLFLQPATGSSAADAASATTQSREDRAVSIRPGSGRPLFFVHDGAGELGYVLLLAPHIDSQIPLYGLPAQPAQEAPKRTVEVMAMRMVRMIRAVQPIGPYRLAGWSFGGVLAYEIATQLLAADEKVEFIGLLDSTYLAGIKDPVGPVPQFNEKDLLLSMVRDHPRPEHPENIQNIISELRASTLDFTAIVQRLQESALLPERWKHLSITQIQQSLARVRVCIVANAGYCAQRIPVAISLFVANDNLSATLLGWNAALPSDRIIVRQLPGTHLSMLSAPNVEVLGQSLSRVISNVPAKIAENDYSPLAVMQTGQRSMVPLFCVPGAGASVASFVDLTMYIKSRSVYGFEPRGLDGVLLPHSTVPAIAQCYLRAMQQAYSTGPVQLLGHSFGGWVVFEMAIRLAEQGRNVPLLTILDSWIPDDDDLLREYNHVEAIMDWIDIFEMLLQRPLGITIKDLELRSEAARIDLLHSRMVSNGLMPKRSKPDVLYGAVHAFAMSLRAHYKPDRQYLGPVQLILVDDSRLNSAANQQYHETAIQGWKRWAPNLIYIKGKGNHMTSLKSPHVAELAQLMSDPAAVKAG